MNQTAHRVIMIGLVGLLFYLLVWPFINSLISGNYYIQAHNEGGQTMSYIVHINSNLQLQASINYHNNIATEEQGEQATGPYNTTISQETYEKIKAIIGEYSGIHLFARQHAGYAFYYNNNDNFSAFYTMTEKNNFFALAETLTWIARGDEKVDKTRSSKTYNTRGLERLDEIYAKLGL